MGIYLNPGNEVFRRITAAEIYVDKTKMISVTHKILDSADNYICISRARRFGKTITQNMLAAYYSKGCDSRELFVGLKIADDQSFEQGLNKYNVIQIDMNSEYQNTKHKDEFIWKLTEKIVKEFRTAFPNVIFSDDDTLAEYTFLNAGKFAEYVGFTADEVRELCDNHNIDFEECRHWYDGYTMGNYEIYNPESVVMCMEEGSFEGYWSKTSSYRVILDRIRQNFKGTKDDVIRMLAGESVDVNVTRYMNTMDSFAGKDDVFTYLLHLGYLAYNREEKTCRIPNREVRQEWFNAIEDDDNYQTTDEIIKASKELLDETIRGNEEASGQ